MLGLIGYCCWWLAVGCSLDDWVGCYYYCSMVVSYGYLGWWLLFVGVVVRDGRGLLIQWWRSSSVDDDKRTAEWNGIIRRILGLRIGCVRRWWCLVLNAIWCAANHRAAVANGEYGMWRGISCSMVVGMDDEMMFVDGELLCVGCFSWVRLCRFNNYVLMILK